LKIKEELKAVVDVLRKKFDPCAIILFGSRARGDHVPWSDYDVLIIADFKLSYLDRIGKILESLGRLKPFIEPHPYTLNEALNMLKKGNATIFDALDEGIILHEDGRCTKLRELFVELKEKGMRRTRTTIIIP